MFIISQLTWSQQQQNKKNRHPKSNHSNEEEEKKHQSIDSSAKIRNESIFLIFYNVIISNSIYMN